MGFGQSALFLAGGIFLLLRLLSRVERNDSSLHGGGWVGPAIVGGLALGALAAAPRYGYGYGPSYAYGPGYYGCPRRVVGYTEWGRPIVRRVCY